MSKAVDDRSFHPMSSQKFRILPRMISAEMCGQRPPIETTWAEIDDSGHRIGKLMAAEYEQIVQRQHSEHYDDTKPCTGASAGPITALSLRQFPPSTGQLLAERSPTPTRCW